MKSVALKLFVFVLVGMVAYGGYLYLMAPEKVYCTRLLQLCEVSGEESRQTCRSVLEPLADKNASAMRDAATCAVESTSCTKAAGCLFGASSAVGLREIQKLGPLLRNAPGLVEDFLDGVSSGASNLLK